jgi:hypothetical protein
MGEPVSHILQGDQLESLSDCLVQGFRGPGLDGSQIPFQLRPQVSIGLKSGEYGDK